METLYSERGQLQMSLQMRRRLVKTFMDVIILSKLKDQPMSGYDVISLVYRKFHILPGSGSVYAILYSLEREGLIKGRWDKRKRIYILTSKGEETVRTTATSCEGIGPFIVSLLSK